MLKKLIAVCALVFGGASFAQLPVPLDFSVGQRWIGTDEAGFYGGVRTYLPLTRVELFGVTPYLTPELGIDRDTLDPYARLELTLDSEYATTAVFLTRRGSMTYVNIEIRFCAFSSTCSQ